MIYANIISIDMPISVEEPDIIELETRYWQLKSQSKTGRFDMETFQAAVCPPVPRTLAQGTFYQKKCYSLILVPALCYEKKYHMFTILLY